MDQQDGIPHGKVELAASTGNITKPPHSRTRPPSPQPPKEQDEVRGYFETAQWTADGTTILTSSSSNQISGYIVPSDLLSPKSSPLTLTPQATIQLPEPSNVLAGAPYFALSEPWTNQLLVSSRDHPIQLFYLTPTSTSTSPGPASAYPLTAARSETLQTAASLVWPAPGTHFVAGSRNQLARFDVRRNGAEPLLRIPTIPSARHVAKGGGVGMRGTVSALSAQPPEATGASLVAAATWTRCVGLYDFAQAGECIATWSVAAAARECGASVGSGSGSGVVGGAGAEDGGGGAVGGDGITQTIWSPCGRYLLISERKSRGILVYDVRVTGRLLGWLSGREALGNQRIQCDVFPGQEGSGGFEVWSGTSHGAVKVWEGVGSREGAHVPGWQWDAHRSTVGSTCVHQSGSVVATCSGSWEFPDENVDGDERSESGSDSSADSSSGDSGTDVSWMRRRNKESSLKIWGISGGESEELAGTREDDGALE
ncbi:hypothetical protein F4779DRAFT_641615 [Xylariaceae sp. FL0662B]|nr:hypothetical protein F4779DRAFT_641615 [Xylariaceae sp. FL0662B]